MGFSVKIAPGVRVRASSRGVRTSIAPPPILPDDGKIRSEHERVALQGIGLFKRAERAAAKQRAAEAAAADFAALKPQAEMDAARAQKALDQQWQQLLGNDPDAVIATLAEAFEDNEAPSAPIGVADDEVSLVVLVPAESAVPERMPGTTQAGNLTLRKLPKGERASLYTLLVAGHVLVTLREAFAVAPGINAALVIALRSEGADAYGKGPA